MIPATPSKQTTRLRFTRREDSRSLWVSPCPGRFHGPRVTTRSGPHRRLPATDVSTPCPPDIVRTSARLQQFTQPLHLTAVLVVLDEPEAVSAVRLPREIFGRLLKGLPFSGQLDVLSPQLCVGDLQTNNHPRKVLLPRRAARPAATPSGGHTTDWTRTCHQPRSCSGAVSYKPTAR